mgnify:CR=1 FL=1|jgi:phage anti-repressor protein
MQNLTIIENELVPVYETSNGEKVVYGSELHEVLGVRTPYKDWSSRRLLDVDAAENEDFEAAQICAPSGQTKKDHIIKLDTAKEMAMLERNEKGKQVRRYFIQVEKKFKTGKPKSALEMLQLQSQALFEVNEKVDTVKQELDDFKLDMPLLAVECDRITTAVHKRGVDALGGKQSNAYRDTSMRSKVYQDIHRELKRQFGVSTYKALKRNQCDQAVAIIDEYELPFVLTEEIRDCNAQISMTTM